MKFEIEFVCTDLRPVSASKEKQLLAYLKPLHLTNSEIATGDEALPYYKHLGILKPAENTAVFNSRNFLRLPQFENYRLSIRPCNYDMVRGPRVSRQFTSDLYGVVNRMKLGFDFKIKYPKRRFDEPENREAKERTGKGQKTFELMKFLTRLRVRVKKSKTEFALYELGKKLAGLISVSTVPHRKPAGQTGSEFLQPEEKGQVLYCGAVGVFTCTKEEIVDFPGHIKEFRTKKLPDGIKINYYDLHVNSGKENIRFYFIIHDGKIPAGYLTDLGTNLIGLWTYFQVLNKVVFDTGLSPKRFSSFMEDILEKIDGIKNDTEFGFINFGEQDKGEIMASKNRKEIQDRIDMLYHSPVSFH